MQSLILLVVGFLVGLAVAIKIKSGPGSAVRSESERLLIDSRSQSLGIDPEVAVHLPDRRIQAIKIYRDKYKTDLKSSKEQIDAWCKQLGY